MTFIPITSEEQWLTLKHEDLTASEVACFYDPLAFKSELELYYEKQGAIPDPVGPEDVNYIRMEAGKFLEPFIARMFSEEFGPELENLKGYLRHDKIAKFAASPDYRHPTLAEGQVYDNLCGREGYKQPITHEDGEGLIELKIINPFAFSETFGDEPSLKYITQLQAQLACGGYKWGAICALVDNGKIETYFYRADKEFIADIEANVNAFWKNVDNKTEPLATGKDDGKLLRSLYPNLIKEAPVEMHDNDELSEVLDKFFIANEAKKANDKESKKYRALAMQITKEQGKVDCKGFHINNTGKSYLIKENKNYVQ